MRDDVYPESDIEEPDSSPIFTNYPALMNEHHIVEFICDYFRLIVYFKHATFLNLKP